MHVAPCSVLARVFLFFFLVFFLFVFLFFTRSSLLCPCDCLSFKQRAIFRWALQALSGEYEAQYASILCIKQLSVFLCACPNTRCFSDVLCRQLLKETRKYVSTLRAKLVMVAQMACRKQKLGLKVCDPHQSTPTAVYRHTVAEESRCSASRCEVS